MKTKGLHVMKRFAELVLSAAEHKLRPRVFKRFA